MVAGITRIEVGRRGGSMHFEKLATAALMMAMSAAAQSTVKHIQTLNSGIVKPTILLTTARRFTAVMKSSSGVKTTHAIMSRGTCERSASASQ
jgi:hypothetical protein